jgi:hypothetical protein
MAENQLFPVFELPEIQDSPEYEEKYRPSVYFDFEKGDFRRDGASRMVASDGREAYIQWCLKVVETERESCLAYSTDIGTEFEDMRELPDRESRESEIERTITEALLVHPATEYVRDFVFSYAGDETEVEFTVKGFPWEEITLSATLRR